MRKFSVFHPVNGVMNHNCDTSLTFTKVCETDQPSINSVFYNTQNDFNMAYKSLKIRSTSVGDIIRDEQANTYFMIEGVGMSLVTPDKLPTMIEYEPKNI